MGELPPNRRHHLLISGPGRSGTTFLVQYLTALGLDTTLSRREENAFYDRNAKAGFEELPIAQSSWPYVVKTPWLHEFIDPLLKDDSLVVDAVIVPVRPLQVAAASRVILESRAIHEMHPWMAEHEQAWTQWGFTAGGCFMSLEPLDQARLIAVGFYELVEQLIRADVPIAFLAFPRFVEDPDYLFEKLGPLLPTVTVDRARAVHRSIADPTMLRVDGELQSISARQSAACPQVGIDGLERVALRRELGRVRQLLAEAEAATGKAEATCEELRYRLAATLASNSWKLTTPLRAVAKVWRRVIRRDDQARCR
jgi:hypothetical protein